MSAHPRKPKWRMWHEVMLDKHQLQRGVDFMKAEEVEARARERLPASLKRFPFKIDMALQDPRPLNPLAMGDCQIYIYAGASKQVSKEGLTDLFRYLPGKAAQ